MTVLPGNVLVPLRLHGQALLLEGEAAGQHELCLVVVGHGGGHGLGLFLLRHQVYSVKETLTLVTGLQALLLLFKTGTFQYEFLDLFPELK